MGWDRGQAFDFAILAVKSLALKIRSNFVLGKRHRGSENRRIQGLTPSVAALFTRGFSLAMLVPPSYDLALLELCHIVNEQKLAQSPSSSLRPSNNSANRLHCGEDLSH